MFEPKKFYTAADVRAHLRLGTSTLANWRHDGKGPPFVKCGSRILYPGDALIEWLERNLVKPERAN